MIHFRSFCWPWPSTFWPWNRCAILPVGWATFLPISFSTYGPTPDRRTMWHHNLDLWPWRSWRWLVMFSYSIYVPSLKFVGLSVRKIWCTSDLSISRCGDLDLWPWNWWVGWATFLSILVSNISFISDTFLCPLISYVYSLRHIRSNDETFYFVIINGLFQMSINGKLHLHFSLSVSVLNCYFYILELPVRKILRFYTIARHTASMRRT